MVIKYVNYKSDNVCTLSPCNIKFLTKELSESLRIAIELELVKAFTNDVITTSTVANKKRFKICNVKNHRIFFQLL